MNKNELNEMYKRVDKLEAKLDSLDELQKDLMSVLRGESELQTVQDKAKALAKRLQEYGIDG